jgi:hypothetical protein
MSAWIPMKDRGTSSVDSKELYHPENSISATALCVLSISVRASRERAMLRRPQFC